MTYANRTLPAKFLTANGQSLSLWAYIFLALLALAFFIPGIVTLPPTDRDESSFAQASKQMMETGDYVDIHLQDKPRYKKPIGIYWLQTASVNLLNPKRRDEIWAYRIPSMLGATLSVIMTAVIGSFLFGPLAGFLAALMMAGCVILNVEARLAKTDACLLGSIMVMQYALARAYLAKERNAPMGWSMFFAFWTALGVGILLKGPIILLVLFSTLLWLYFSDKTLHWFNDLKPWMGLGYLLLIVVPWFVAIALQSHGGFMAESAGHDLLGKVWTGQNRVLLPPGMHLLVFPIIFFPFALFTQLAIPDTWVNRKKPEIQFCLGWIVLTWIVFEISLTKLPHYTLPTYPAIAMLTAKALMEGYPVLAEKNIRWLTAPAIGLWMMIGMGFAVAFSVLPSVTDHVWYAPEIIAAVILVLAQAVALFMMFHMRTSSIVAITFGSMLFMATTFGLMLPSLEHLWVSRQAVAVANMIKPCEQLHIVSASYGEPSLVFLAGTDTKILADGAAAAEAMKQDACAVGLIDIKHKQNFLSDFAKSETQPAPMGKAEGINTGHSHATELTLYLLPRNPVNP